MLIIEYVRLFSHTDLGDAVSYFSLIKDKSKREECIENLIFESRDVQTLRGFIEHFLEKDADLVFSRSANKFVEKGNVALAIELLLMEHKKQMDQNNLSSIKACLKIVITELGQELVGGRMQHEINALAIKVSEELGRIDLHLFQSDEEKKLKETFYTLLGLVDFFNLARSSNSDDISRAWQVNIEAKTAALT